MIRTYPPNAVRAERSEGIARRAEQAVRGTTRMRENCTYGSMRGGRSRSTLHPRNLIDSAKKLWHDLTWNQYFEWQGLDRRTLKRINTLTSEKRKNWGPPGFTGITENCYTTNQSQESTCLTMLRNERCVGYWKAGRKFDRLWLK